MTQQEKDEKLRHDYELATEIARRMYGLEGEQTPQDASSAAGAAQTGAPTEPWPWTPGEEGAAYRASMNPLRW